MTRSQVGAHLVALIVTTAATSYVVAAIGYSGEFGPDALGTALGATLGTMVWLVVVPGILPVIWWAVRGFRSETANGPLVLWWVLLILTLVPLITGTMRAHATEISEAKQPLCMSDDELLAFLMQVMIEGTERGADVCCSRYTSATVDCTQRGQYSKSLGSYFWLTRAIAIRPFQRAFGSAAEARFAENLQAAVAMGDAERATFSEEQCSKYMKGVAAMAAAGSDTMELAVKRSFLPYERPRVPKCP